MLGNLPQQVAYGTDLQGYRLGDAQMQFEITVQVDVIGAAGNSSQQLSITPSMPTAVSSAANVSAVLLGDLASYQSSPNFNYAILMIPSPQGSPALARCYSVGGHTIIAC